MFEGVERVDRKIVVTCPHCFNTLGREYPQVGGNYTVLHHTQLLNRLIRDKKLVPVTPGRARTSPTTTRATWAGTTRCTTAPRELIGASGATLTEMPRHADRGLCCGAGGARMWMEEHIGKRVNHERVEEALDTGASKIATGCPFCRVMMTDGVDDLAEAMGKEKAEVLDVAQLLLGSLDKSTVTLPEKGAAAEAAAAKVETAAKAETAPARSGAGRSRAGRKPRPTRDVEAKPVTGLGIAGGAKRPGAKKSRPGRPADKPAAAAPRRQGTRHRRRRQAARREEDRPGRRGHGRCPGRTHQGRAGREGARHRRGREATRREEDGPRRQRLQPPKPPQPQPESTAPEPQTAPEPPVKGLGIAPGARRPGAKKATAPTQPAAAPPQPAAASPSPKPEPDGEASDDTGEAPAPPVKGLGIARGARPPGKR